MLPGMQVWLLRHGRVLLPPGMCYGRADVAADAQHTTQAAQTLWDHWRHSGQPVPRVVWCSPRQRTRQLADALRSLGLDAPIQLDERLAEMDFGCWEGRAWADIAEPELTAWTSDFSDYRPGGGESTTQFLERVASAWSALGAGSPDVLWVTHAGVIRAVHWLLTHGCHTSPQPAQWPHHAPEPGKWTRLRWKPLDTG
jgi:alpha-ribazole phosphatase